jgi:hypothetical protein
MENIHADSDMTISVKLDNGVVRMNNYSVSREITTEERVLLVEALQGILDAVKANTR